jgi:hypothetical protein
MRGAKVDPEYAFSPSQSASLASSASKDFVPAYTWCRTEFALPEMPNGWSVPWRLIVNADRDASIYLNGRLEGCYAAAMRPL